MPNPAIDSKSETDYLPNRAYGSALPILANLGHTIASWTAFWKLNNRKTGRYLPWTDHDIEWLRIIVAKAADGQQLTVTGRP